MYFDTTSQTGIAPAVVLYVSLTLSVLSMGGNVFQYLAGRRARAAAVRAKEAEIEKTESDRNSVDVSTLNTLLKTVNEQVHQVIEMRRAHEGERLKDRELLMELRMGLAECQGAHEESERERARLAHELQETRGSLGETGARLAQLEDIIRGMGEKGVVSG